MANGASHLTHPYRCCAVYRKGTLGMVENYIDVELSKVGREKGG